MWEIIIDVILILIIVDIYLRIRNNTDEIWYLLLITDTINKTLADNKVIDKEKLRKSMKEVVINAKITKPKNYEKVLKALGRKGIVLDM